MALAHDELYLVFYVTCTDLTKTFDDLLQLLVNTAESVDNVQVDGSSGHLIDRTTRKKLALKIFELESTKKYATESDRLSYQELNLEEKLVQLCELLTNAYGQRVLFIIDELDRMEDSSGLASFLKAVSSETLKFVLVGIAGNVSDLIGDHQSLERRLVPVRVQTMSAKELGQIVLKAQEYLSVNDVPIRFSREALLRLISVAGGFPWFTHVLGQQCLVDADARDAVQIEATDVQDAIDSIVDNRFAQQFADVYQMAVRDSILRELTLRAFAHWTDIDIPTSEVYRILKALGVNAPSTYKGHLCAGDYGAVLIAPAFQKRGLVRFRNEMFKAYIRMRPSIYEGVATRVRVEYSKRP